MSLYYDPNSNIGKVRNLTGDVGPVFALEDTEITGLLNMVNTDFFQAAALACRRLAASQFKLSIIRKAGNYMQDMSSLAKNLMDLAKSYDELARSVPCDAQAEVIATDFNYNQLLTDKVHRGEPFDNF